MGGVDRVHERWLESGQHDALELGGGIETFEIDGLLWDKYNMGIQGCWDTWILRQCDKKFLGKATA